MATQKIMLSRFSWDQGYRVFDIDKVLTPALVVYPDVIESNIARTLHLLGGDAADIAERRGAAGVSGIDQGDLEPRAL